MATEIESKRTKELERQNEIVKMISFLIHNNIQIEELKDLNLIIKHETGFSIQSKSKETEIFISNNIFFSNKHDYFKHFLKSFSDEKYGKTLYEFYESSREWAGSFGLNNQHVSYLCMIPNIFENRKIDEETWDVLLNKLNEINNEMKTEILLEGFIDQTIKEFDNEIKNKPIHFYKMLNYAKNETKSLENLTELEKAQVKQIQLFLEIIAVPSNLVSKEIFMKIEEMTETINAFHSNFFNKITHTSLNGVQSGAKVVSGVVEGFCKSLGEIGEKLNSELDKFSELLAEKKAEKDRKMIEKKGQEMEKKYDRYKSPLL